MLLTMPLETHLGMMLESMVVEGVGDKVGDSVMVDGVGDDVGDSFGDDVGANGNIE